MSFKLIALPMIAGAGIAIGGLATAPAASASDSCTTAVSTSRCLGPQGVDGFVVPAPDAGVQNGPYGTWGFVPPIGR